MEPSLADLNWVIGIRTRVSKNKSSASLWPLKRSAFPLDGKAQAKPKQTKLF
jgi:hypothetical protein